MVAIDTSSQIKVHPDVWIVAIRNNRYHYTGVYINRDYQRQFQNERNWVEKLYAILYYKTSNSLLSASDNIVIDKDFQGSQANHIKQYMTNLFGFFQSSDPEIQFLPAKLSKEIREAHFMTKRARYKKISVQKNPPIKREFEYLG
ncbi:MAG: hypothetical protein WCF23_18045 [Candidatus Nitrosopolaris sp.]